VGVWKVIVVVGFVVLAGVTYLYLGLIAKDVPVFAGSNFEHVGVGSSRL
jgi:hypothetical protein